MAAVQEEQLDPRIQVELEKLNTATDDINKLESKLEETNNVFSSTFAESTARLKTMGKKLGNCIEKARPYYEALELARTSQLECQRAAVQYQRANALHQAAKETIALAEERFVNSRSENWQFDSAWQEMLNHATMKVMEAEAQKAASEREHMRRAAVFQQEEQRVQQLQRGLKSSINKSLGYFEEKLRVEAQLEGQKERVQQLQTAIAAAKATYAQSLRRLEQISEQIHEQRRCQMPREPGVGAELTSPPPGEDHQYNKNDKHFLPPADLSQDEKYWESLREKLEKLNENGDKCLASDTLEAASPESAEGRERSLTGSSDPSSCNGERVVSGQSSSQESESDGGSSSEGASQSPSDVAAEGAVTSSLKAAESDDGNVDEKVTKGRRTPPGSCVEVVNVDEIEGSRGTTPNELSVGSAAEESCQGKASCKTSVMLSKPFHDAMPEKDCTAQLVSGKEMTMTKDCEIGTNELEIIELDEEVEDVFEGNLGDGNAVEKEKGDGSSSPPPAPCQPSKNLTVIVEELEHCALPE